MRRERRQREEAEYKRKRKQQKRRRIWTKEVEEGLVVREVDKPEGSVHNIDSPVKDDVDQLVKFTAPASRRDLSEVRPRESVLSLFSEFPVGEGAGPSGWHPYIKDEVHISRNEAADQSKECSRIGENKWALGGGSTHGITREEHPGESEDFGKCMRGEKNPRSSRKKRKDIADMDIDTQGYTNTIGSNVSDMQTEALPRKTLIYLPLAGFSTYLIAYFVTAASILISDALHSLSQRSGDLRRGIYFLAGLKGLALVLGFALTLSISPKFSFGSGIPEVKCILEGIYMKQMLNLRTMIGKMLGLVFTMASGISIGMLGPYVHMSTIIASLLTKIPLFSDLQTSSGLHRQAMASATAAGAGATFGAPVGGTFLALELLNSNKLVYWWPMALYCSIMGYFFIVTVIKAETTSYFSNSVRIQLYINSATHLAPYVILGVLCGVLSAGLIMCSKLAFVSRRALFSTSTPFRTGFMLLCFGTVHSLVTFNVGGIIAVNQKEGLEALFNETSPWESWIKNFWNSSTSEKWNHSFALAFQTGTKFLLTCWSLAMPIPAGAFKPIFELGALFGRTCGEVCKSLGYFPWIDSRFTAIVGAAAMAAGTLQVTSVVVVILELSREAIDVLPLIVSVLVSYAISKQVCSDLYSEFTNSRRISYFLLFHHHQKSENQYIRKMLSSELAFSIMSPIFPYITPETKRRELRALLSANEAKWTQVAFLSDNEQRILFGSVKLETLRKVVHKDTVTGYKLKASRSKSSLYGSTDLKYLDEELYLDKPLKFLQNYNPLAGSPLVERGPLQVSVVTPLSRVLYYFKTLPIDAVYVIDNGVTVGQITRSKMVREYISIRERMKENVCATGDLKDQMARLERKIIQKRGNFAAPAQLSSSSTNAML